MKAKRINIDSLLASYSLKVADEKKLFAPEIKISIAYCDSLFEAGIFNRLEAEKVKNALLTILKRSEFDKNYFDKANAENIYKFIEEKLINLIGELGQKIHFGRSFEERSSTAQRLFLRDEVTEISKSIRELQTDFIKLSETNESQTFITKPKKDSKQIILLTHWCLAHFEMFKEDRDRLDEVWRRINTLPLGANNGIGTSLEFDREELAKRLGFDRITSNSLYAFGNQNYLIEFANCVSIIATNLLHLIDELFLYKYSGYLNANQSFNQENIDLIIGKLRKVFTNQAELQQNLANKTLKFNKNFKGNIETIFETVKSLRNCLDIISIWITSISINDINLNKELAKLLPNKYEIVEYLIQRGEHIELAKEKAKRIEMLLIANQSLENTELSDLKLISEKVESDFFIELTIENIINSKNQIGGTSHQRVAEALAEAKRALHFEE